MEIDYDEVRLEVVDMTRYERRNVYSPDGIDLLWVEYLLGFVATYAPGGRPVMPSVQALSEATLHRAGVGGADDTIAELRRAPRGKEPGEHKRVELAPHMETVETRVDNFRSGPETDAELHFRLARNRGRFVLWAHDRQTGLPFKWLESPRPGASCDATGGPQVLSCDVINASGDPHSVSVQWQVTSCLPPCPAGSDRLVLSHRWEMSHAHDEDNYLTRVVEGEIVFNAAVKDVLPFRPELLRNQFLHPIPIGFRRSAPRLVLSSDGLTVRYVVTDTDPTIVFAAGDSGATRIEIVERHGLTVPARAIG